MLLGNGFLLDKLPIDYIGNVVSNNNFTNPSMMLKTYTAFPQYDSIPAGYGGRSIVLPIKAGAGSIIDRVAVVQYASMANSDDSIAIALDTIMSAYAKASAADVVVVALDSSLTAYANASMGDTVIVDISAFIGAVMGASADDTIHVTMSGTIGALLGISATDTVTIAMSGNIGGYYGGVVHDTVVVTGNTPIIFGSALATANDSVNVVMNSSVKGDGWMRADAQEGASVLTAKEIWEYYHRTLTSGDISGGGLTAEQVAMLQSILNNTSLIPATL